MTMRLLSAAVQREAYELTYQRDDGPEMCQLVPRTIHNKRTIARLIASHHTGRFELDEFEHA